MHEHAKYIFLKNHFIEYDSEQFYFLTKHFLGLQVTYFPENE